MSSALDHTRPLGPRNRHYWLVKRMAAATRTDLCAAFDAGDLAPQDWARSVEACRACAWVDGCERWLDRAAQQPRSSAQPSAPDGCSNRHRLAALKALQMTRSEET